MLRAAPGAETDDGRLRRAAPSPNAGSPVATVVIFTYNSRQRVDFALVGLTAQDFEEPWEIVLVDSGEDDCATYVQSRYPSVRVVRSAERLRPGPARNRGVAAARGEIIAFCPDDGLVRPDWLSRRVAMHRKGYQAVGGAVTNATPGHPVGTAGYLLEYSAVIPSDRVLAEQPIPHGLSYTRALLDRVGPFPEDTDTGEDTLVNRRLVAAGVEVGFDAEVQLGHRNHTAVMPYLRHQYGHGRGLVQCIERHGLGSPIGSASQTSRWSWYRVFIVYPARRWWLGLDRIRRGRRRWMASYLALSPLIWAGLWATSLGVWHEWRRQCDR